MIIAQHSAQKKTETGRMIQIAVQPQFDLMEKKEFNDNLDILKPEPVDVLCGRGRMCFSHVGNDSYRLLISKHVRSYQSAPTKKAKMNVIHNVVEIIIDRGGRFLVRNKGEGHWTDGGIKQGKKKTGHALRDALRGRVTYASGNTNKRSSSVLDNLDSIEIDYNSSSLDAAAENGGDSTIDDHLSIVGKQNSEIINNNNDVKISTKLEPEKDWRNSILDRELATEVLDFFIED